MSKGYTQVPHDLSEPLMRLKLNGTQGRIVWWVIRNSIGRQHAEFAPYTWSGIAKDIGAPRVRVSVAGRALLEMGVLWVGEEGEIGIDKQRITLLAESTNSYGYETVQHESVTPSVTKSYALSYSKERRKESAPLPLVSDDVVGSSIDASPTPFPFSPVDLMELWNREAVTIGLPRASKLTPTRVKQAQARLKDEPTREYWESVLEAVKVSPFLRGKNDRKWKASFDWMIQPDTSVKVLEGKYGNDLIGGSGNGSEHLIG